MLARSPDPRYRRASKLTGPRYEARAELRRGVAQPGRALPSGGRGRRFESSLPDHLKLRFCPRNVRATALDERSGWKKFSCAMAYRRGSAGQHVRAPALRYVDPERVGAGEARPAGAARGRRNGRVQAGIPRIAKDTGLSERTVHRALVKLERAGHITRKIKPGIGTIYTVHPCHSVTHDRVSPLTERQENPCRVASKLPRTTTSQKAYPSSRERARAGPMPAEFKPIITDNVRSIVAA